MKIYYYFVSLSIDSFSYLGYTTVVIWLERELKKSRFVVNVVVQSEV